MSKGITNIRAAVNNMTDEELAEALSSFFTIKDNKLVDCDSVACFTDCQLYGECSGDCEASRLEYMLKEAE